MPQRSINSLIDSLIGAPPTDESNKAGRADRMPLQVGPLDPEDFARQRRRQQIYEATTTGDSSLPRPDSPIESLVEKLIGQIRPAPAYQKLEDIYGSPWLEDDKMPHHMSPKNRELWFAALQAAVNQR